MAKVKCCHCAFESSARGIRTHMAVQHGALSPPESFGRPKGPVCPLCGWVHVDSDEAPREGPVYGRKSFERGKVAAVIGTIPRGGRRVKIGEITVPEGVTRISKVGFSFDFCKGPFTGARDAQGRRYCLSCRRLHKVIRVRGSGPKRPYT